MRDPEGRHLVSRRGRCSIACALLILCSIAVRADREKVPMETLDSPPIASNLEHGS